MLRALDHVVLGGGATPPLALASHAPFARLVIELQLAGHAEVPVAVLHRSVLALASYAATAAADATMGRHPLRPSPGSVSAGQT